MDETQIEWALKKLASIKEDITEIAETPEPGRTELLALIGKAAGGLFQVVQVVEMLVKEQRPPG